MTKLVEFTRDMRPWRRGDRYALPDDKADELVESGVGVVVPSLFDPKVDEDRRKNLTYRTRGRFARREDRR